MRQRWRVTLTLSDAGLGVGVLMWLIRRVLEVVHDAPVPVMVRVERVDDEKS